MFIDAKQSEVEHRGGVWVCDGIELGFSAVSESFIIQLSNGNIGYSGNRWINLH